MSLNTTFHWPAGPEEVKVTGTFDNWSGSFPLVKQANGEFELVIPLDPIEDKYLFKFIVDGDWKTSSEYDIANEDGNENNVLFSKDIAAASEAGTKIPESGGLVTPTVMPSQEGKQTTVAGEPGIFIPENPNEIKAFTEIHDVDAKALNEKLNGNKAAETSAIVIPENAADIKEFSEVRDVDAKELNAAKATEEVSEGKKKIKVKKVIKRNKETGEEIVLSTEPVTEEEAKPEAAPVVKEAPKVPAPPVPVKKEKKEKKGFFSKLKKAFA